MRLKYLDDKESGRKGDGWMVMMKVFLILVRRGGMDGMRKKFFFPSSVFLMSPFFLVCFFQCGVFF